MSYQNSLSLGQESKDIISSIKTHGKDITGNLDGKKGSFYKKELLNYVKNDYKKEKDGKNLFEKVMLVMSFEASDNSDCQKIMLQILAKHPEFRNIIAPSLNKDLLSDPDNINNLNAVFIDGSIDKNQYVEIMEKIVKENINTDKLHNAISYELKNYGPSCPVNKKMTDCYLSHPNIKDDKMDDILSFWSKNKVSKEINIEEQEQMLAEYIQMLYLSSQGHKKDQMSNSTRDYMISSINDNINSRVSADVAEEAMGDMLYLYEQKPEIRTVIYNSLCNMAKQPEFSEIVNSVIGKNEDKPEVLEIFLNEIKNKPKKFTADSVASLPYLSYLYPEKSDEYISAAASVLRNADAGLDVTSIFWDGKVYKSENSEEKFTDIFDDKYKYLTHIVLNDSKLSPEDVVYVADSIINNLEDRLEYIYDDEDDDSDMSLMSSEDKEAYGHFREYLEMMADSKIINSDKSEYTRFMVCIKEREICGDYPEPTTKEFHRIFEKNKDKIKPSFFISELITLTKFYNEEGIEYEIDENVFDFIEKYAKATNFSSEEKENALLSLNGFRDGADKSDIQRYDRIISVINSKHDKINITEEMYKKRLGRK